MGINADDIMRVVEEINASEKSRNEQATLAVDLGSNCTIQGTTTSRIRAARHWPKQGGRTCGSSTSVAIALLRKQQHRGEGLRGTGQSGVEGTAETPP